MASDFSFDVVSKVEYTVVDEAIAIAMKEILNRIKSLGVSLALDDFGTGYSSLNHIREIPIDVIKVDQSFVKDLAEDAYSQSFIKMVAELAETIGVSVCVARGASSGSACDSIPLPTPVPPAKP